MTTSPACFSTLPSEIHSIIVTQSYLQDAVYLKAKQAGHEPFSFIESKGWKWHGRSLMALYSTCRSMKVLAEPLVFETLAISMTISSVFHVFILKKHAQSFVKLKLDCVEKATLEPEEEEDEDGGPEHWQRQRQAVKDFFLSTLSHLPNLRHVEIISVKTFFYMNEVLPQLSRSEWSSYNSKAEAVAKDVARTFSHSITSISLHARLIEVLCFEQRFNNLRNLSIFCDSADFAGLRAADLPALEGLASLCLTFDNCARTRDRTLPINWTSIPWNSKSTLTSLDLDLATVHDVDWRFVVNFAPTLTFLSLKFGDWKLNPLKRDFDYFSRLETLKISAELKYLSKVLGRIIPSATLSTLQLKVVPSLEKKGEPGQWKVLMHYLQPDITLKPSMEIVVQPSLCDEEDPLSKLRGVATVRTPTAWQLAEIKVWDYFDDEELSTRISSSDIISQLDFVRDQVLQAERVGDQAAVVEWARWMEPLAGKRNLGTY